MKVFITGATGFIGSSVARALVKKGYEVKCLVRSNSNLKWISDLKITCHFGNLNNPESLGKGLFDADYVYHLAGTTKSLNKKKYFEELMTFKESSVRVLDANHYIFYDKWYYTAVREALAFFPLTDNDFGNLGKCVIPSISEKQVAQSIQLLLELNLVEKDDSVT